MTKRAELECYRDEVLRDLSAFSNALQCIEDRIKEREEAGALNDFADWAGTKAAVNVLIMVKVRCLGLLEDLDRAIEETPAGLSLVLTEDGDDTSN